MDTESESLKEENERLRLSLQSLTAKYEQYKQRDVSLEHEIAEYTKTKAAYQSIVDEYTSLKSTVKSLEQQLHHNRDLMAKQKVFVTKFQNQSLSPSHTLSEKRYQNTIQQLKKHNANLKQQIKEYKTHKTVLNEPNKNDNTKAEELENGKAVDQRQNEWIQLVLGRMEEESHKRDRTRIMQQSLLSKVTVTELQARFSELLLVFQREYNQHRVSLSTIKQLHCERDLQRIELQSIQSQSLDLQRSLHQMQSQCTKYRALYGLLDGEESTECSDDDGVTVESLQQTVSALTKERDAFKWQMESMQKEMEQQCKVAVTQKTSVLSAENEQLRLRVGHLETECGDKTEAIKRYEHRIESLSETLNRVETESNGKDEEEDKDKENENEDLKASNASHSENEGESESESATMQRMYRDQILQLQQQMDRCNMERSVVEGDHARLERQCKDWCLENQRLSQHKVYLNGIIDKLKVKVTNLNGNIAEQQKVTLSLESRLNTLNDSHSELRTRYLEVEMERDILKQRDTGRSAENLQHRIQCVELKKLISVLKGEATLFKEQNEAIKRDCKLIKDKMEAMRSQMDGQSKEECDGDDNDNENEHTLMVKENQELKDAVHNLKQKMSTMECDLNRTRKQLEISKKNENLIPGLKAEIQELQEKVLQSGGDKDEDHDNIATESDNPSGNAPQRRQSLSMLQDNEELLDELGQLETECTKKSQTMERFQHRMQEMTEMKGKLKESRQIAVKLQLENEGLTHQIEQYQLSLSNKTRDLSQQIEDLKHQITALRDAESTKNAEIEDLKKRYSKSQGMYQRELRNHVKAQQKVKQYQEQIQSLSSSTPMTMTKVAKASDHHNETENGNQNKNKSVNGDSEISQIAVLEAELAAFQTTTERLKTENRLLSEEITLMKSRDRKLQHSLSREASTLSDGDHDNHDNQRIEGGGGGSGHNLSVEAFNQLQSRYHSTSKALDAARKQCSDLKAQNIECNALCTRLKNENETMMQKMTVITKEKEALYQRNTSYLTTYPQIDPDELDAAKASIQSLEKELKQKTQEMETQKMKMEEMNNGSKQRQELMMEIAECKTTMKALEATVARKEGEIGRFLEEARKLKEVLEKMKALSIKKNANMEALTKRNGVLQQQIKSKTDTFMSRMKAMEQAFAVKKTEMESQIKSLQTEKDDLKAMQSRLQQEIKKGTERVTQLMEEKQSALQLAEQEKKKRLNSLETTQSDSMTMKELKEENEELKQIRSSLQERGRERENEWNQKRKALTTEIKRLRDAAKSKIEALSKERAQSVEAVEATGREKEEIEERLKAKETEIEGMKKEMMALTEKYKLSAEEAKKYLNKSIAAMTEKQRLQNEMKQKTQRVEQLETSLKAKETEMDRIKNVENTFALKSTQFEKERDALNVQITGLQSKIKEQNTTISEMESKLESKDKASKEKDSVHQNLKTKLIETKRELALKKQECTKLKEQQKMDHDTKQDEKQKEFDAMKGKNEKLMAVMKKMKIEIDSFKLKSKSMESEKESHRKAIEEKETQIEAIKTEMMALTEKYKSSVDEAKKYLNKSIAAMTEKQRLQNEMEQKTKTIEDLESSLQSMTSKEVELSKEVTTLKKEIAKQSKTITDLKGRPSKKAYKKANKRYDELKTLNDSIQKEMNEMKKQKEQMTSQMEQLKESQSAEQELQQSVERQSREISQKDEALKKVLAIADQYKVQIQKLQKEITTKKEEIEEIHNVKGKVDGLTTEIETLQNELKEKQNEIERISTEMTASKTLAEEKQNALNALQQKIGDNVQRTESLEEMERERRHLEGQLKKSRDAVSRLEKEMKTLGKEHRSEMKEVIQKLMAETTKLQNVHKERESLKTDIAAIQKENMVLKTEMDTLKEDMAKSAEEEKDRRSAMESECKESEQRLKEEIEELQSTLKVQRETEDAMKQKIANLEAMDLEAMKSELSSVKQMLMKEKAIRNEVEADRENLKGLNKIQEKQIRKLKAKSPSPLKRGQRTMSLSSSSLSSLSTLSTLPPPKVSGRKRKIKDMKPIVLSDDSDENENDDATKNKNKNNSSSPRRSPRLAGRGGGESQNSPRPRKRMRKSPSNKDASIDLTADAISLPISTLSASSSSRKKKHSATEMNQMLKERLEKMKKSSVKSPKSLTRKWCSFNVNFSESNSLDPESVDSSFPSFDLHFYAIPILKEKVSKWTKPRQDILSVSQRMTVSEFQSEVSFDEWCNDENRIPSDIALFKCEHSATPNKTKMKPFIRVNKLLSEQDRIGVAECARDYKLYFIPSSAKPSKVLNRNYQQKVGSAHDRMWVIWKKLKSQKEQNKNNKKESKDKEAMNNEANDEEKTENGEEVTTSTHDPFAAFADGAGGFNSLLG